MVILYPPYIEAKQNAFVYNEKGKIYFNTSILNSIDEVKFIQVIINRVDNNSNVLENILTGSGTNYSKKYPTGYLFIPKEEETIIYDPKLGLYYFELPKELLSPGIHYKIQIRLGQVAITLKPDGFWQTESGEIINNSWLNNPVNVQKMSEWSSVGVFKVLHPMKIGIQDLNENIVNTINTSVYTFIGTIDYGKNVSDEALKTVKFDLYKDNNLIETSGILEQPSNQKEYHYYTFKHVLDSETEYNVSLSIETISGYKKTINYRIMPQYSVLPTTYKIEEYNNTIGYSSQELNLFKTGVRLLITDKPYRNLTEAQLKLRPNTYIIRKASEKSNFEDWEEIAQIRCSPDGAELRQVFFDPYIESGIKYKYTVQPILLNTSRGLVSNSIEVVKDYNYTWLIGQNNLYLQIDYSLNISNYKKVVKEAMIETLDSKYPFFIRNGAVNYRTFNLSGSITKEMDVENKLNDKDGYVGEREFRNALESFLQDGKPKVFKSSTEDLILVYITDVTLTPKQTLGRTIYDFSCVFTEIDDFNSENLKKYNLLPNTPLGLGEDLRVPAIVGYVSETGRITPNRAIVGVY